MTNQDVFSKDSTYVSHTYNRFPAAIQSGHGATARDFDGNEYIDFGSGIGANALGFCNDEWVNAVTTQLRRVQHTSNLFYTLPNTQLAENLCQITGYSKVFFCNSGAEANEGAIKLARKYGREKRVSGAIRSLRCKIPSMAGRSQHCPQPDRILSISTFPHLRKDSGMCRSMTVSSCPMRLMHLSVVSWWNLSRARAA